MLIQAQQIQAEQQKTDTGDPFDNDRADPFGYLGTDVSSQQGSGKHAQEEDKVKVAELEMPY